MKKVLNVAATLSVTLAGVLFFSSPGFAQMNAGQPRCSSDRDCQSPGMRGFCQNPGQPSAGCVYQEAAKVKVTIIKPKECAVCSTDDVIKGLKTVFPGLEEETIDLSDPRSQKLISDLKIEVLPAYVLSKNIEQDMNFQRFSQAVDLINGQYYVKPSVAGASYFLGRDKKPGKVDLFILLTQKEAMHALKISKELIDSRKEKMSFQLHFIGVQDPETNAFSNPVGLREINEDKMYLCVEKNYPAKTWDYLFCRAPDVESPFWEDCMAKNEIDSAKIKECVKGEEANQLFKEKIKLAGELQMPFAPIFLLDNVEVFSATDKTSSSEINVILEAKSALSAQAKKSQP